MELTDFAVLGISGVGVGGLGSFYSSLGLAECRGLGASGWRAFGQCDFRVSGFRVQVLHQGLGVLSPRGDFPMGLGFKGSDSR